MTAEELIDKAQSELVDDKKYTCTRKKKGVPCTQQHENEIDDDGRSVFFYATDCKVVEKFCPACLAYWHVAVARNCLYNYARVTASVKSLVEERAKP